MAISTSKNSYKVRCFKVQISLFLLLISSAFHVHGQNPAYEVLGVGFYNVENLFDTKNDTLIDDEEFLPEGTKAWTEDKYQEKIANIASVISQLGKELCKDGLSLIGVSEIENEKVLEDLIRHPILSQRKLGILHHESSDKRGIDVAMIYDTEKYTPIDQKAYSVDITRGSDSHKRYTRDVVLYTGELAGEKIHVTVNHWPSRSGGEKKSEWKRKNAALVNRHILDSLLVEDPKAKLIIMGDLNDDPTNKSLTECLRAEKKYRKVEDDDVFNPMSEIFSNGKGTTAYRDRWSLFDQILVSPGLLQKNDNSFFYQKATIYNKRYLIENKGKYKGYPKRTFNFDVYQGGYSDHLPVVAYILKVVE